MLALAFPVHCCWAFSKPRLGGGKYDRLLILAKEHLEHINAKVEKAKEIANAERAKR